jgi:large subunit ribosomal protein L24
MAARIRKGDRVIVITGRSKGKIGDVLKVMPDENRAVVHGVNMVKRHTAPGRGQSGGIIEKEGPINLSNLAHVDPKSNAPTRIGFRTLADGRKVRYAKRSGEIIDR